MGQVERPEDVKVPGRYRVDNPAAPAHGQVFEVDGASPVGGRGEWFVGRLPEVIDPGSGRPARSWHRFDELIELEP